jgi:alkylation response protein AidB-like acyl-CoA dehydrogenase
VSAPRVQAPPSQDGVEREILAAVRERIAPLVDDAESRGRFPRVAIAELGALGAFRQRWAQGHRGDPERACRLAEALGRAGTGAIGTGVTVHGEAVLSVLVRFGATPALRRLTRAALDGTTVGCLAASEDRAGSDLLEVATRARPEGDGWRVRGTKAYASLGAVADFALVLCRAEDGAGRSRGPVVAVVDRDGFEVRERLGVLSARSLETVRLDVDAHVGPDALLGRLGHGLRVVNWGLTHERLAAAAQVIGGARLALGLAAAHLARRRQGGQRLLDRQALRLRLADLAAQVALARRGVHAAAADFDPDRPEAHREIAGVKVTVARLGERVVSECLHLFGGLGLVEEATPLARMWRDVRLARIGGGTDEIMWELVAGGLTPDHAAYDALVGAPS